MRVRSTIPHEDSKHVIHPAGEEYDLPDGSLELELRLKDYIVVPVENAPAVPPSVFTPVGEA